MIGLLVFFGIIIIKINLYLFAFPEVSIFWGFIFGILFPKPWLIGIDPSQGAEQFSPFQVYYPLFKFSHEHILPLHVAFRVGFIVLILGGYYLLAKYVHIKGIYVFQVAGVLLVGYLAYLTMTQGFELSLIWSIVWTLIVTFIASGMRYTIFYPLKSKE